MSEWDVAIGREGVVGRRIMFPRPLARGLDAKGYNRAKVRVTAEGILLVPYKSEEAAKNGAAMLSADLPDWEGQ